MRALLIVALVALAFGLLGAPKASAQAAVKIEDRGAEISFPDTITFKAHVESSTEISRAVLEYGTNEATCSKVTAKAFPQFTPGTSADLKWIWEMRKSGSMPPGAKVWYRWRVTDKAGHDIVSDQHEALWLDSKHGWKSIQSKNIALHWYDQDQTFANDVLKVAEETAANRSRAMGVTLQSPIDVYMYASNQDLRDAVLYEQDWVGGIAYPKYDVVILNAQPDQPEWAHRGAAHETTHIITGHLTFSCVSTLTKWIDEGLAMNSEGPLDDTARSQLYQAAHENSLISVRALGSRFSANARRAEQSYSESYSLVSFLLTTYGEAKMVRLLKDLRDGVALDSALQKEYGFDQDGLEGQWRASMGAEPRRADTQDSLATPVPTPVPTLQPVGVSRVTNTDSATNKQAAPVQGFAFVLAPIAFVALSGLLWLAGTRKRV